MGTRWADSSRGWKDWLKEMGWNKKEGEEIREPREAKLLRQISQAARGWAALCIKRNKSHSNIHFACVWDYQPSNLIPSALTLCISESMYTHMHAHTTNTNSGLMKKHYPPVTPRLLLMLTLSDKHTCVCFVSASDTWQPHHVTGNHKGVVYLHLKWQLFCAQSQLNPCHINGSLRIYITYILYLFTDDAARNYQLRNRF